MEVKVHIALRDSNSIDTPIPYLNIIYLSGGQSIIRPELFFSFLVFLTTSSHCRFDSYALSFGSEKGFGLCIIDGIMWAPNHLKEKRKNDARKKKTKKKKKKNLI